MAILEDVAVPKDDDIETIYDLVRTMRYVADELIYLAPKIGEYWGDQGRMMHTVADRVEVLMTVTPSQRVAIGPQLRQFAEESRVETKRILKVIMTPERLAQMTRDEQERRRQREGR